MKLSDTECVTRRLYGPFARLIVYIRKVKVSPPFGQGALGADTFIKAAWYFMGADTV